MAMPTMISAALAKTTPAMPNPNASGARLGVGTGTTGDATTGGDATMTEGDATMTLGDATTLGETTDGLAASARAVAHAKNTTNNADRIVVEQCRPAVVRLARAPYKPWTETITPESLLLWGSR